MTEHEKKVLDSYDNIPRSKDGMMSLLASIHDYMWKGYDKELAIMLLEFERDGYSEKINTKELRELLKRCEEERQNAKQGYLNMIALQKEKLKARKKKNKSVEKSK